MTYTRAQIETEYPPLMKRGQVIELGRKLGMTTWTVRQLIEGPDAVLKPNVIGGQLRGYFKRNDVLAVMLA